MKFPAKLLLGIAVIGAAACGDKSNQLATDSTLARDLALASAQPAQPTFQDTAIALAPAPAVETPKRDTPAPIKRRSAPPPKPAPREVVQQPAPAPTPAQEAPIVVPQAAAPAPAPAARGEIGAGSAGTLTSAGKVCTSTNLVGDKIVATLDAPLEGTHGAELPAGSTVVLELASLQSGDKAENAQLTFRVRSIVVNDKTYNVNAEVVPTSPLDRSKVQGDPNADKKKVAGGAIAGAILGQIIGRNTKGTVIGAAAGAAAGAAVAKSQEKWEACLPSGAQLRLKLNEPLVLM